LLQRFLVRPTLLYVNLLVSTFICINILFFTFRIMISEKPFTSDVVVVSTDTAVLPAVSASPPPLHACPDCGKTFRQASNLRTHLKVHGKVAGEFFICGLCGRDFQYKNSLRVHLGTHDPGGNDTLLHDCAYCSKSFAFKSDLAAHANALHTRERTFECTKCARKFYHRSSLRVHVKSVHEAAASSKVASSKFECSHCGVRMSDASNMRAHERLHTGEKRFQCPQCVKPFARASDLKQHVLVHADGANFECSECGKGFRSRKGWKKHERNAHPVLVKVVDIDKDGGMLFCLDE
jgi:KRAB domain-containing zinc finger protein